MSAPDLQSVVLDVIRGTRPLGDLALAGVLVHIMDGDSTAEYTRKWCFQAPENLEVLAKSSDVAKGIMNNLNKPSAMRNWAGFLFAAPFITFDFNAERDGLSLIDLLMTDLSTGDMPNAAEIDKLRSIAES